MSDTDWLDTFLPVLRCPASGQPLHRAAETEKQARRWSSDMVALVSEDGAHWYPVEQGIPILLPPEGNKMP